MYKGVKYTIVRSREIIVPTMDNLGMMQSRNMGARAVDLIAQELEVEESELNSKERIYLRRDPRTRAMAPAMPMTLINPVDSKVVGESPSGNTWGVEAVGATKSSFDGSGITVAVLDTGIDPSHPAFTGVNLIQRNFTSESDNDLNGHGTHCAGTIFGRDVDGTRIGVAPGIERALIGKVLGDNGGSSTIIAQAIQWALNEGAHIISMSLGIDFPGFVKFLVEAQELTIEAATSIALESYRANINLFGELSRFVEAQGALLGQGTIIVSASGNESRRPQFEIAVAPPAASTGIVAVGALQQNPSGGFSVANFSNDQVNISAPGVDVISARLGGGLVSFSGTSMATPHAAGIAALWAQRLLDATGSVNSQILKARLIASGSLSPLSPNQEPDDIGAGIVQAP